MFLRFVFIFAQAAIVSGSDDDEEPVGEDAGSDNENSGSGSEELSDSDDLADAGELDALANEANASIEDLMKAYPGI